MKKNKIFLMIIFVLSALIFFNVSISAERKGYYYGAALGYPSCILGGLVFDEVSYEIDMGVSGTDFSCRLKKIYNKSVYKASFAWWDFPVNLGWGIKFRNSSHPQFGLMGSVTGSYSLRNGSTEVFLEISPVYRLMPSYGANLDFSVGLKWGNSVNQKD